MSGAGAGARTWRTLAAAGTVAAAFAAGGAAAAPAAAAGPTARESRTLWYEWFRSRPDLRPPKVRVGTPASGVAPGYVFLGAIPAVHPTAHRGPMIVDNAGRLVWFKRLPQGMAPADLRVQAYRGQPVLTWWQGRFIPGGFGCGVGVIADTSYRTIATVRPTDQGRYCPDLHEFQLTPRGTALMMFYRRARVNGRMLLDNIIEEVDVATGKVLFRWSAARHVPIGESYVTAYKDRSRPYDWFHANSVDQDAAGNFLISARHTWTVYKLDRNGKIVWRLGGKRSDFPVPATARFGWQHDARFQPDGTISLLDNAARRGRFLVRRISTAFVLRLDEARRTVSVVRKYVHPDGLLARSQANFQILPNGNAFVGWGEAPAVSEFSRGGTMLFELQLPPSAPSYRAYRFPWFGRPAEAPRVAAERSPLGGVAVFMSWNGSTELRGWQVVAGNTRSGMRPVATVPSKGFQTSYRVVTPARYFAARALDGRGRVLRSARSVTP